MQKKEKPHPGVGTAFIEIKNLVYLEYVTLTA